MKMNVVFVNSISKYIYMIEIIENLWLSKYDSITEDFIKNKKISLIINCSIDTPFPKFTDNNSKRYRLSIHDNSNDIDLNLLIKYNKKINTFLDNNKSVLIYCNTSAQCSSMLITSYLLQYSKLNYDIIIKSIQSKNDISFNPENNFINLIKKLEFHLKNKNI